MKFARFSYNGRVGIGAISDTTEAPSCIPAWLDSALPNRFPELIMSSEAHVRLRQLDGKANIPLTELSLLAPVQNPQKFLGVGLNYKDHIDETELEAPSFPTFFNKQSSCIIGPNAAIHRPKLSEKLDYEGELALIIGKQCRHVPYAKAHTVIAGYTIVNDVSVRDWQIKAPTWTLGKSFDTHGPIGPFVVSAKGFNPHNLDIKTWVNNELRQHSNTKHLLFDCFELVSTLSQVCTLMPGDIIATGTPAGVGVKMKPRGYMKPGDTVKVEIEHIGVLENPIIEEPVDTAIY